jgi:hypothetical protein
MGIPTCTIAGYCISLMGSLTPLVTLILISLLSADPYFVAKAPFFFPTVEFCDENV